MEFIVGFLFALLAVFALTVVFGPPFVRSHKKSIETALDLLDLENEDHLLDLGSGDGSVLLAAAKRGASATGYEINPFLVFISRWRTRSYKDSVQIVWGNMWKAPIDKSTQNIYMFLDPRFLNKVAEMIEKSGTKVKLVSYSYELANKKPDKSSQGVHLYSFGD